MLSVSLRPQTVASSLYVLGFGFDLESDHLD